MVTIKSQLLDAMQSSSCPYLLDKSLGNPIQLNAFVIEPASTGPIPSFLYTDREMFKDGTMVAESFAAIDASQAVAAPALVDGVGHSDWRYCGDFSAATCTYRCT